MSSPPGRPSAFPRATFAHRKRPTGVRDLMPIFVVIWIAGVVRLAIALVRRERFGGELIVVFLAVVILPLLLFSPRLARRL